MGGEFSHRPHGVEALARTIKDVQAGVSKSRAVAVTRSSAISGGDGITVKSQVDGAGSIHLWVQTADGTSLHDATLDFQPSEPTINPARFRVQDDGPGLNGTDYPLQLTSVEAANNLGSASRIVLSPGSVTISSSTAGSSSRYFSLVDGQPAQLNGWKLDATTLDSPAGSTAMRWQSASGEWQAKTTAGAYGIVRAASFPMSSSRGAKQDVTDLPFDPLEVIAAAPAQQWQYKPERAADTDRHISPMADDLPADLVRGEGADMTVDTRDLVGVLWAAIAAQQGQIACLQEQVAELVTGQGATT